MRERPEQGALARAVAAQQGDDVTRVHVDGDVVQHRGATELDLDGLGQEEPFAARRGLRLGVRTGQLDRGGAPARVAHRERRRVPAEQRTEPGDGRCAGIAREHRGRAGVRGDDATLGHEHRVVRDRRGPFEPVLRDHDRGAEVRVEARHRREHVLGSLGIELAGRLVEHEDRRCGHQCPGDRAPLPFAAGQRRGIAVAQVRDAERVHHLLDPPAHAGRIQSEVLQPERDVGFHPVDHELRLGVLVHEPDDVREAGAGDDRASTDRTRRPRR